MRAASIWNAASSHRTSNSVFSIFSDGCSRRDTARINSAFASTYITLDARLSAAGRDVIRERVLDAIGMPFAFWKRLNHAVPFTLGRVLAARASIARSQLAMHAIVFGTMLVPHSMQRRW